MMVAAPPPIVSSAPAGSIQRHGVNCAVTIPQRRACRGFGPEGFNYGNNRIRAELYWPRGVLTAGIRPDGGAMAIINKDGSIRLKLGWWRGLPRRLVVSGHRLDAAAPALRSEIPTGYGTGGFQPTALIFPTVGCWRVAGRLGPARLTFVLRVTTIKPTG